jgi:O-antigen ligase
MAGQALRMTMLNIPSSDAENRFLRQALGILIFILPAFAVLLNHGASTPFLLLVLVAVMLLPLLPGWQSISKGEKLLLFIFFAMFAWPLISWASVGFVDTGLKHVGRAARFAIFIPVYFLLRRLAPSVNWLFYGLLCGAIGAGSWALLNLYFGFDNTHGSRASGATHPILFGDLALIMGVMAISFWQSCGSTLQRALVVVALLLGLTASLLSASRGGWLAIPILAALLLWRAWSTLKTGQRSMILAALILLPVALYFVPAADVRYRINTAYSDIERYQQGDTMGNSLGERLAMWHAAWIIFKNNPLTGAGVGQFVQQAQQLRDTGQVLLFNSQHYHAHNVYFTAMAQSGSIGLAILLAVFLYPLRLFYRALWSGSAEVRALALAGVCLVIAYMQFGLSEAIFSRSLPIIFYVFNVLTLLALIRSKQIQTTRV